MMEHSTFSEQRMNAITPYLNFGGNTREAMTFYHSVLGGDS
jgi:predicted 3-demethylubiquinone-9 3-methyltransferase (glyoxalase superfamily)